MAQEKFPKLRAMGDLGGHAANVLTFLTTNWGATLATIIAAGTWLNKWAWGIALTPAVYASAGVFLFVLWTIIGLTYLYDRRKPRKVQTHLDYRYGLTFEGFGPNYMSADAGFPDAGALQFVIQVRNYSPGPIQYFLESCDIRLDSRASPKYEPGKVRGYMARGSGRSARTGAFKPDMLKEFYAKGVIDGTADFSFTYGAPDEPPQRRLKISLNIHISVPPDGIVDPVNGHPFGYSDSIISEKDEPI